MLISLLRTYLQPYKRALVAVVALQFLGTIADDLSRLPMKIECELFQFFAQIKFLLSGRRSCQDQMCLSAASRSAINTSASSRPI